MESAAETRAEENRIRREKYAIDRENKSRAKRLRMSNKKIFNRNGLDLDELAILDPIIAQGRPAMKFRTV